jgi:hypothetical protein
MEHLEFSFDQSDRTVCSFSNLGLHVVRAAPSEALPSTLPMLDAATVASGRLHVFLARSRQDTNKVAISAALFVAGMRSHVTPAVGEYTAVLGRTLGSVADDIAALQYGDAGVVRADDAPFTGAAVLAVLLRRQIEVFQVARRVDPEVDSLAFLLYRTPLPPEQSVSLAPRNPLPRTQPLTRRWPSTCGSKSVRPGCGFFHVCTCPPCHACLLASSTVC